VLSHLEMTIVKFAGPKLERVKSELKNKK